SQVRRPVAAAVRRGGATSGTGLTGVAVVLRLSPAPVAQTAHHQRDRALLRGSATENPTYAVLCERRKCGPHHLLHLPEIQSGMENPHPQPIYTSCLTSPKSRLWLNPRHDLARPAYPPTARRLAMARSMHVVPVTSSEVSVTSFCHDVREIMLSVGFRNQAGGNYQLVHLRRDPAVLGVAGCKSAGLFVHPTELFNIIARHRIAFGFRINAVHARGVQAEDAPLYFIAQRFPTKPLHQLVGTSEMKTDLYAGETRLSFWPC